MEDPMLQFFEYKHLPEVLAETSRPFCELAQRMVNGPFARPGTEVPGPLPRNPERTAALRKLLEAKDCAVRAALYKDPSPAASGNVEAR